MKAFGPNTDALYRSNLAWNLLDNKRSFFKAEKQTAANENQNGKVFIGSYGEGHRKTKVSNTGLVPRRAPWEHEWEPKANHASFIMLSQTAKDQAWQMIPMLLFIKHGPDVSDS